MWHWSSSVSFLYTLLPSSLVIMSFFSFRGHIFLTSIGYATHVVSHRCPSLVNHSNWRWLLCLPASYIVHALCIVNLSSSSAYSPFASWHFWFGARSSPLSFVLSVFVDFVISPGLVWLVSMSIILFSSHVIPGHIFLTPFLTR